MIEGEGFLVEADEEKEGMLEHNYEFLISNFESNQNY